MADGFTQYLQPAKFLCSPHHTVLIPNFSGSSDYAPGQDKLSSSFLGFHRTSSRPVKLSFVFAPVDLIRMLVFGSKYTVQHSYTHDPIDFALPHAAISDPVYHNCDMAVGPLVQNNPLTGGSRAASFVPSAPSILSPRLHGVVQQPMALPSLRSNNGQPGPIVRSGRSLVCFVRHRLPGSVSMFMDGKVHFKYVASLAVVPSSACPCLAEPLAGF